MTKALGNAVTFLIVALGAMVASRALGDTQAVADGAARAAGIFDSLSQYPVFLAFVSWFGTELGTRLWPTRYKTSTFYFLREFSRIAVVVFTALERVFDHLYQHPFAQKQRASAVPAGEAAAPAPEPPKERVG
jgi:hypothetical protein